MCSNIILFIPSRQNQGIGMQKIYVKNITLYFSLKISEKLGPSPENYIFEFFKSS